MSADSAGTAETPTTSAAEPLARPIDPTARYGAGLDRALVLGGGGVWFVAWQSTYLDTLRSLGIDWGLAQRVVGTSAGSLVAAAVSGGRLGRLATEVSLLSRVPALVGALAPAAELHPSQERALELFQQAPDADPARVRSIGHAALAAQTPPAAMMVRNVRLIVGGGAWPSPALTVTATDTWSGERLAVTAGHGVRGALACAASSAVPGLFSPQQLGDRRAMDGGVRGSGTHADLVAGASRAIVVALSDGSTMPGPAMTITPTTFSTEMDGVRAQGTALLTLVADTPADPADLMDPAAVPAAVAAAQRRAHADVDAVRDFWAP